jgi:membrane protein
MPTQALANKRLPWHRVVVGVFVGAALAAVKRQGVSGGPTGGSPRAAQEPPKAAAEPSKKDKAAFGGEKSTDEPQWKQHERAKEGARGREAEGPTQIPWRGWKDILLRVYEEIGKDRLLAVAAGVVFYALLAIFPGITALVSSYGLFFDFSTINQHMSLLSGIMPPTAFGLVQEQVGRIVAKGAGQLSMGFLFGLGLALWSANAGMKAVFDALNVIYDEEEKRSFIWLNVISLTFTLGAIVTMLLAVAAVVVFPLVLTFLGITTINPLLISILRWPILFALVILGLALLYRYGPSRHEAEWRWLSVGSVFAAVSWIIASLAFSFYLSKFADFDATYGSLGAVIGLMMWMWISAIVILTGAELNAEIEHQTAQDSTKGPEKPMGARGAAMADTVGEAKAA